MQSLSTINPRPTPTENLTFRSALYLLALLNVKLNKNRFAGPQLAIGPSKEYTSHIIEYLGTAELIKSNGSDWELSYNAAYGLVFPEHPSSTVTNEIADTQGLYNILAGALKGRHWFEQNKREIVEAWQDIAWQEFIQYFYVLRGKYRFPENAEHLLIQWGKAALSIISLSEACYYLWSYVVSTWPTFPWGRIDINSLFLTKVIQPMTEAVETSAPSKCIMRLTRNKSLPTSSISYCFSNIVLGIGDLAFYETANHDSLEKLLLT